MHLHAFLGFPSFVIKYPDLITQCMDVHHTKWKMSKEFILLGQWVSPVRSAKFNPTRHTYNPGYHLFKLKWLAGSNHQIIHLCIHTHIWIIHECYLIFLILDDFYMEVFHFSSIFRLGFSMKETIRAASARSGWGLRPEAAPEEIFTRDTITKRMPKILVPGNMGMTWKMAGKLWCFYGENMG